jgi:hypothetical protein
MGVSRERKPPPILVYSNVAQDAETAAEGYRQPFPVDNLNGSYEPAQALALVSAARSERSA